MKIIANNWNHKVFCMWLFTTHLVFDHTPHTLQNWLTHPLRTVCTHLQSVPVCCAQPQIPSDQAKMQQGNLRSNDFISDDHWCHFSHLLKISFRKSNPYKIPKCLQKSNLLIIWKPFDQAKKQQGNLCSNDFISDDHRCRFSHLLKSSFKVA